MLEKLKGYIDKKNILFSAFLSFVLGMTFVLGYQLKSDGMTYVGIKGKLIILLIALAIGAIITPFTYILFGWLKKKQSRNSLVYTSKKSNIFVFWISLISIFILWIPHFLAFYPAILSYDFNVQYVSAMKGVEFFTTHHPLIHTFLIRQFILLGTHFGSAQTGIAIFAIVQMLIMACVMAYSCNLIYRLTGKKLFAFVTAGFYAIFPINAILTLCMTKDVLFSAFFLLFVLLLIELELTGIKRIAIIVFVIADGVALLLFRNNAIYAFIVFAIVYVSMSGKEWYKSLAVSVIIIVISIVSLVGMQKLMRAESGNKIEMYSVFLQTFARVGMNQRSLLTDEEYNIIDSYVPNEIWTSYNPAIADNVKNYISDNYDWNVDNVKLIKDWIYIGVHYPNDYIDAFLSLTCGYWSVFDESHAGVWGNGASLGMGLISTFNASSNVYFDSIENESFLPIIKTWDIKLVNDNVYMKVPVISLFFKPALYCLCLLVIFIGSLYLKKKKLCVITAWPILYLMTLYLGPVVNIRYAYPIMISIPIIVIYAIVSVNGVANEIKNKN